MSGRHPPKFWTLVLIGLVVTPLAMSVAVGRLHDAGMGFELSLASGLVALSLLVAAFALPSRLRTLTSQLGIETVLRSHRTVAVLAVLFVLGHVGLVVYSNPDGLGILDLRDAPARVWAATIATVALLGLLVLAITRRRRRPRYEGWRLVHLGLALTILVGAGLHVLWLHNLIDHPVMRWWFVGLAALVVALMLYRWGWRPVRAWRRSYVVDEVRSASTSAVTVTMRARNHAGLRFRPGQFVWLKFGGSPFVFEEHPFTIASAATNPAHKEFTIKALGDFTELIGSLRPGRHVYLDGPHGRFTLDRVDAPGFVFIAGGVGITPMLSMIRTLADRRDQRPLLLLTGGRTIDELLHRDDVNELRQRVDLTVVEVLDDPPEDWDGETGYVNANLLARHLPDPRRRRRWGYFVCGPPPMVGAVLVALTELGVPDARIHTELFDMV